MSYAAVATKPRPHYVYYGSKQHQCYFQDQLQEAETIGFITSLQLWCHSHQVVGSWYGTPQELCKLSSSIHT